MLLRDWLKQANLTQAQFAKTIESDQAHVSDLVNGKVRPRAQMMDRINEATKGSVAHADWAQAPVRRVRLKKLLKAVRKAER